MKKIFVTLLFAGLLCACYEDKGNYNYKLDDMNDMRSLSFTPSITKGIEGSIIEVQKPLTEDETVRRIEVDVEQTLASNIDKLEFSWSRTYINAEGVEVNDTLYTPGYVDLEIPLDRDIEYKMFLRVYDTETALSIYEEFKVKTRPIFKNSLFVLHGDDGARKLGNIEVVGNDTYVRTDIKQMPAAPDNNYSNAVGLAYSTYADIHQNHPGYWAEESYLTVFDNNSSAVAYNPHGMNIKHSPDYMFLPYLPDVPDIQDGHEEFVFKKMIQTGAPSNTSFYRIALSESGTIYTGNSVYQMFMPGYGNEVSANPDPQHQADYKITAATITRNRFVMWDAKNNRFLYSSKSDSYTNSYFDAVSATNLNSPVYDAKVDFTSLEKSPEGMTAVLGYINYRENYDEQPAYFVFKDEATGEFYRYKLTTVGGKGSTTASDAAFLIEGEKMKYFVPGDNLSSVTYNSWFTTNYLFYADGKFVYRYNVLNGDRMIVYEAPADYQVDIIKFRAEDSSAMTHTADLGLYLSIGLFNGVNGAVAEMKLNTAADIDKNFTPVFYEADENGVKWGRIKDLQFVYEYMYGTSHGLSGF